MAVTLVSSSVVDSRRRVVYSAKALPRVELPGRDVLATAERQGLRVVCVPLDMCHASEDYLVRHSGIDRGGIVAGPTGGARGWPSSSGRSRAVPLNWVRPSSRSLWWRVPAWPCMPSIQPTGGVLPRVTGSAGRPGCAASGMTSCTARSVTASRSWSAVTVSGCPGFGIDSIAIDRPSA